MNVCLENFDIIHRFFLRKINTETNIAHSLQQPASE